MHPNIITKYALTVGLPNVVSTSGIGIVYPSESGSIFVWIGGLFETRRLLKTNISRGDALRLRGILVGTYKL